MNNTRTMKIRELLDMSDVSIDVYDNVCEEISVAFEWDGTLELTEDGKNYFAEVLDFDITIGDNNGYAYGVVDVGGDEGVWQHKLRIASEFFYAAAGYCSCEDYDRWFTEKAHDPDDEPEQYLVRVTSDSGSDVSLKTATWILDWLDMQDCYPPDLSIAVWKVADGAPQEVTLYGAWHKPDEPLYMKDCLPDGTIVFDGYGTDH